MTCAVKVAHKARHGGGGEPREQAPPYEGARVRTYSSLFYSQQQPATSHTPSSQMDDQFWTWQPPSPPMAGWPQAMNASVPAAPEPLDQVFTMRSMANPDSLRTLAVFNPYEVHVPPPHITVPPAALHEYGGASGPAWPGAPLPELARDPNSQDSTPSPYTPPHNVAWPVSTSIAPYSTEYTGIDASTIPHYGHNSLQSPTYQNAPFSCLTTALRAPGVCPEAADRFSGQYERYSSSILGLDVPTNINSEVAPPNVGQELVAREGVAIADQLSLDAFVDRNYFPAILSTLSASSSEVVDESTTSGVPTLQGDDQTVAPLPLSVPDVLHANPLYASTPRRLPTTTSPVPATTPQDGPIAPATPSSDQHTHVTSALNVPQPPPRPRTPITSTISPVISGEALKDLKAPIAPDPPAPLSTRHPNVDDKSERPESALQDSQRVCAVANSDLRWKPVVTQAEVRNQSKSARDEGEKTEGAKKKKKKVQQTASEPQDGVCHSAADTRDGPPSTDSVQPQADPAPGTEGHTIDTPAASDSGPNAPAVPTAFKFSAPEPSTSSPRGASTSKKSHQPARRNAKSRANAENKDGQPSKRQRCGPKKLPGTMITMTGQSNPESARPRGKKSSSGQDVAAQESAGASKTQEGGEPEGTNSDLLIVQEYVNGEPLKHDPGRPGRYVFSNTYEITCTESKLRGCPGQKRNRKRKTLDQ